MAKYRMYSLVLKQLTPMQKGVQSAHSIVEYASKYHKRLEFMNWSNVDKTIIILDGGTYPELKECRLTLDSLKIPYAVFYESDLNNIMTSISFIVDERVWNTTDYPSFEFSKDMEQSESEYPDWLVKMGGEVNLKLRNFIFSKRLAN